MKTHFYRAAVLIKVLLILAVVFLIFQKEKIDSEKSNLVSSSEDHLESSIAHMHSLVVPKDAFVATDIRVRQILNMYEYCNTQRLILDKDGECEKP